MMEMYSESLRVALLQTTSDSEVAWKAGTANFPEMDTLEARRTWDEVRNAITAISVQPDDKKPHIIILPEFGIANRYVSDLRLFARQLGVIIVSGLDFSCKDGVNVKNEAIVCIPYNWPHGKGNCEEASFRFGKRFPAWKEKQMIEGEKGNETGLKFNPTSSFYILNLGKYGNVGLAICADFYDIDRYIVYQGRIQHLFLIAYNQDTESFNHLTESYARLVYCNVVICNTGFHGGSMAFSPRKQSYRRIVYSHYGKKLQTIQTVELPVASLLNAQRQYGGGDEYKAPPPGYKYIEINPNPSSNSTPISK